MGQVLTLLELLIGRLLSTRTVAAEHPNDCSVSPVRRRRCWRSILLFVVLTDVFCVLWCWCRCWCRGSRCCFWRMHNLDPVTLDLGGGASVRQHGHGPFVKDNQCEGSRRDNHPHPCTPSDSVVLHPPQCLVHIRLHPVETLIWLYAFVYPRCRPVAQVHEGRHRFYHEAEWEFRGV